MPKRRPYIRKYTFTFNFSFDFNIGAFVRSPKAMGKRIASLARRAIQIVSNARMLLNSQWRHLWKAISGPVAVARSLTAICAAVIVANYLAVQVNGQFQLGLPNETMQVLVEVVVAYFLKKSL